MARETDRDAAGSPERRIITVLAADIVDSTGHIAASDPDDAQLLFDQCFEHLRGVIERWGGSLVNYGGDGGIATFGWPVSLEDHADRASAAAWDIQHAHSAQVGPDGRPVRFRVGLHSGLVALRQIRQDGRSHFDPVGAAVNIAAKLQQFAPAGGVVVSDQTVKLCRIRLILAPLERSPDFGGVHAKAFMLVARPEGGGERDVAHRYSLPVIGRDKELTALRRAAPRRGGQSRSVALIGEPGIGKSRLAVAAVTEALALGARSLVYFGDAHKRTTPFAAARGLIGEMQEHVEGGASADLRGALAGALDEGDVGALEKLLSPDRAQTRDRAPELTQPQLARALVNAFRALAPNCPTVLLVEDLHLIDAESREFLRLLANAPMRQPLCLMLTARPEATDEAREIARDVILLEPLPPEAMRGLGAALWPGDQPPGPMLEQMVERADGVPFVLEELIRSLDGDAAAASETLPHTVESVIHARLQRLSPAARSMAQALSLLGEDVDADLVAAVVGAEPGELPGALGELERFAFIHPTTGRSAHMRHQIISQACANTIPKERRKHLHRAAIEAITTRYPSLDGRYEQLAFHAERAGDDPAALDYLWEAGLEARRNSAAASLNLIFDRALVVIDRIGEAAEEKYVAFVLMAFASTVQLGEFEKMNTHLPRIVELARLRGQPDVVSGALSQLGMICWFEGRYEDGLAATEEGLAIARTLNAPALIFANQIMLANVLHGMGRLDRAIAEGRELSEMLTGDLESARLGAAAIPRSMVLSFMSWFMVDTGAYSEGLEFAERGLEVAVRRKDPYSEVLARCALGRNLIMLRRDAEAVDCLAVARDLSERYGYDAIKANLAGRIAIALSRVGRAAEAIAIVEDCLQRRLHLRTGQLEVYYLFAGYAEALVRHGDIERGLTVLAEALTIARRINNPCWIVDGLGLRARLLALTAPGDPRIEVDLAEQREICSSYGVAAWSVAPASETLRMQSL